MFDLGSDPVLRDESRDLGWVMGWSGRPDDAPIARVSWTPYIASWTGSGVVTAGPDQDVGPFIATWDAGVPAQIWAADGPLAGWTLASNGDTWDWHLASVPDLGQVVRVDTLEP